MGNATVNFQAKTMTRQCIPFCVRSVSPTHSTPKTESLSACRTHAASGI